MSLEHFSGKTAIVTGAGDGIGEMLARKLVEAGLQVGVLDIRKEAAIAVSDALGDAAFPLVADVSDRDALAAAAETVRARGEGISLLWINAGAGVGATLSTGRPSVIEWAYSVNVLGVIWTTQAFLPLLRVTEGTRHVGFTASTASLRDPDMPLTLYAATKQAAFGVAEGLRNELAVDNIPSTILCPGLLNTNIWNGARARPERFGGARQMNPAIATRWKEAKSPDLMWPHIAKTMDTGGGYLVCSTEPDTRIVHTQRAADITAAMIDI